MSTSSANSHAELKRVSSSIRPYDFSAVQTVVDTLSTVPPPPFPPLQNDRILRAARRQHVDTIPVWCHRQAGRYLPEFKHVRSIADSFFTTCQTPIHCAELTAQPLRRFPLDAAIIFSDILVIPQAMGMRVEMKEGVGPFLPNPIKEPTDMVQLTPRDTLNIPKELKYVFDALTLTRHVLAGKVPLIGFSGAPFTLFCYMIEGGGSKTYDKARAFIYKYPQPARELMDRLTEAIIVYLIEQVAAGAQMLEVFDSWAGILPPDLLLDFVLPYLCTIATQVKSGLRARGLDIVPMTVFPKGANFALSALSYSQYDVISLDWATDVAFAKKQTGGRVALQGNLDVSVLYGNEQTIRTHVRRMLDEFGGVGYICNLGHGMLPDHTPAALEVMVDECHTYGRILVERERFNYIKSLLAGVGVTLIAVVGAVTLFGWARPQFFSNNVQIQVNK